MPKLIGNASNQVPTNGDLGSMAFQDSQNVTINQLNLACLNTGSLAGLRNYIINGNFRWWQRGTSLSAGTGIRFICDRWITNSVGTTIAPSLQSFTTGQTDVPDNPMYFYRCVIASVAGASNWALTGQYIENVRTLQGKTVTWSFWAKADAARPVSVEFFQNFGQAGSPSANVTGIGISKVVLDSTWRKFTGTVTLPSISGKTLGTDADYNSVLGMLIWMDAGSSNSARTDTLGQQSGTFDFAHVQLEEGSIATPFERRDVGLELKLCERYFQVMSHSLQASVYGYALYGFNFRTTMRTNPTYVVLNSGSGANATLASESASSIYGGYFQLLIDVASGYYINRLVGYSAEL